MTQISTANGAGITSILTPCTSRKSFPPSQEIRAVSLRRSNQSTLQTAWLERMRSSVGLSPAADLYQGRGFRIAKQVAADVGAPLYVVSAGLGLVAADSWIPSYGITVAPGGDESVASMTVGRFDPSSWWAAVSRGPFATPLSTPLLAGGLTLAALTRSYAAMVASAIDAFPDEALARLRLFGAGLCDLLPDRVRNSVLPYDERLQHLAPGTRADFAQRALRHFVHHVAPILPNADLAGHRAAVQAILDREHLPELPRRPRLSDGEVVEIIASRLSHFPCGIRSTLRALRDEHGIACEQARFSRLYRVAAGRETSP